MRPEELALISRTPCNTRGVEAEVGSEGAVGDPTEPREEGGLSRCPRMEDVSYNVYI